MLKSFKFLLNFLLMAVLVIACTKDVNLLTEVEFEVSEQYRSEGFVNAPLSVNLTVLPEEVITDVTYSYHIESLDSQGILVANGGDSLESGDTIGFNALSAAFEYTAASKGRHTINLTVEDSYGFTKKVTLLFDIVDIPLEWDAKSPITQMELGTALAVTLRLESQTENTNITFQCTYQQSTGSGTLTGFPTTDDQFPQQFTTIVPGNYPLQFTPDVLGMNELLFRLRDSNGQELITSIAIEVVEEIIDTEPPIITILGENPTELFLGVSYTDQGATAMDNVDGDITDEIDTDTSAVNVNAQGSYEVVYTVEDADGNNTTVIRTVNVVPDPNNTYVPVTNININRATLSLVEGSSGALSVVVSPSNATNQGVNWTSSNPAIATVDASGTVTPLSEGDAIITATSQENTTISDNATITVTTTAIPVTGLDITQVNLSLTESNTGALTAVISPANATNQGVDWVSNNPSVATVNASGTVTAVSQGNAIITATSQENNTIFDTTAIAVTVGTIAVTGLDINQANLALVEGNTGTLTAVISPANATNQGVDWVSNNPSVATVNASGTVTAISLGNAIITATSQENNTIFDTAAIAITVGTIAVTGLDISQANLVLVVGNTGTLNAIISPGNATNQGVDWTSNNPAVATVDTFGSVTAIAVGNTTIIATSQVNSSIFDTSAISVISPYRYHRFNYLGNTLPIATSNFCNDIDTGGPNFNISIAQVLPVDNVYLVSGSAAIADGYYRVILNSNNPNAAADDDVSGSFFTNEITPICLTNDLPDASDDAATVTSNSNVVIDVLDNDTDPNNDTLTIFGFTTPNVGTVSQQGNDLRYFSDDSCTTASFDYTIDDGNGGQDTATVTITKTASATFSGGGSVSSSFPSTTGVIEVVCDEVTIVLGAFGGSGGTTTNLNLNGTNYSVTAPANDSLSSLVATLTPGTYNYTLSGSFSGGGSAGSVGALAN